MIQSSSCSKLENGNRLKLLYINNPTSLLFALAVSLSLSCLFCCCCQSQTVLCLREIQTFTEPSLSAQGSRTKLPHPTTTTNAKSDQIPVKEGKKSSWRIPPKDSGRIFRRVQSRCCVDLCLLCRRRSSSSAHDESSIPAPAMSSQQQQPHRRRASHAGSWYSSDGRTLRAELDGWLDRVDVERGPARAIISPHAGYRYCGACAAYAYKQINPDGIRRVFVLGPSHHIRLSGCAVSGCDTYETPLYDLKLDLQVKQDLLSTGEFEVMSIEADEDEHSIEMQLSYLARVMESKGPNSFTVVPILVGSLSTEREKEYGKIFAKYLADPSNLFIISSDFCHWGQRFRYTHYDEKCGEIHQSIKSLDYMGMNLIEELDHDGFAQYLKKFGNTICGRHPIGVFLGAVSALRRQSNGVSMALKFLNYDQSNPCKNMRDSSVSYASASFTIG